MLGGANLHVGQGEFSLGHAKGDPRETILGRARKSAHTGQKIKLERMGRGAWKPRCTRKRNADSTTQGEKTRGSHNAEPKGEKTFFFHISTTPPPDHLQEKKEPLEPTSLSCALPSPIPGPPGRTPPNSEPPPDTDPPTDRIVPEAGRLAPRGHSADKSHTRRRNVSRGDAAGEAPLFRPLSKAFSEPLGPWRPNPQCARGEIWPPRRRRRCLLARA